MNFSRAEFGQYPQDWSISTLGEYIEVLTDYHANGAYKKLKENVELLDEENYSIMIRTTNFEQNDFSLKSFKYINEHAYNFLSKTKVYQNDILMNKIANAGSVYLMPKLNKPVSLAMNLFLIRFNENVIMQKYAYYFMKNYEAYIKTRAQGSVTKTITKENVRKLEIAFPDIEEQTIIVKTLSDIDEKIETNNQINKKLEEMAQAIFKQWFVDFEFPNEDGEPYKSSGGKMVESELGMIPMGWDIKIIGDLTKVVSKGTTPRKNDIDIATDDNVIKFLKVKDIGDDGIIDLSDIEYIPQSVHLNQLKRSILEYKDILISIAGTIGRVSYVDDELIDSNTNQAVAFVRLNDINRYFLIVMYKFKSNEFQNSIKSKVVQGVQANISLTVIKNEKIVIPNENILQRYNCITNDIFDKNTLISKENNRLKAIRDTLLPKLMSGEIRAPLNN